jgi:hypothetical protein
MGHFKSAVDNNIVLSQNWRRIVRNAPLFVILWVRIAFPMVPAKVVEVAFDDRFILAKRYRLKPDPKIRNYEIPDETTAEYYILDTFISKMYVCSNLDEFNKLRETLKVPATLKLKDITSYKAHSLKK